LLRGLTYYEAVSEGEADDRLGRFVRWARGWLWHLGRVFLILLLAALADEIPPLVDLHDYLETNPQPWLGLTIGSSALGWTLLWACWLSLLFGGDRATRRSRARPWPPARRTGDPRRRIIPRRLPGTSSLAEIKEAFRTGAWITDPAVRPMCLGFLGMIFAALGMFGLFIVIGPPSAQIACTAAMLFMVWQLGRGWLRA
jgi:hypothetical protein